MIAKAKPSALKLFLSVAILMSPFAADASVKYTGEVGRVWTHTESWGTYNVNQRGLFMFEVIGMPNSCNNNTGSGLPRVIITTDHPNYDTAVSMVLLAKASAKNLTVEYLETCTIRSNSWDFGFISLPAE